MTNVWFYLANAQWVGKRVRRWAWKVLAGPEWN